MVVLICKKLPQLCFHKGNEGAYDGNSGQSFSQLITPMELCMSLKLFSK